MPSSPAHIFCCRIGIFLIPLLISLLKVMFGNAVKIECQNGGVPYRFNGSMACNCYTTFTGKYCHRYSWNDEAYLFPGLVKRPYPALQPDDIDKEDIQSKCSAWLLNMIRVENGGNGRNCFCKPLAYGRRLQHRAMTCTQDSIVCGVSDECRCRGRRKYNLEGLKAYDGMKCLNFGDKIWKIDASQRTNWTLNRKVIEYLYRKQEEAAEARHQENLRQFREAQQRLAEEKYQRARALDRLLLYIGIGLGIAVLFCIILCGFCCYRVDNSNANGKEKTQQQEHKTGAARENGRNPRSDDQAKPSEDQELCLNGFQQDNNTTSDPSQSSLCDMPMLKIRGSSNHQLKESASPPKQSANAPLLVVEASTEAAQNDDENRNSLPSYSDIFVSI